jgi:hypothetical protein
MNTTHIKEIEIEFATVEIDPRELIDLEVVLIGGGETASNGY